MSGGSAMSNSPQSQQIAQMVSRDMQTSKLSPNQVGIDPRSLPGYDPSIMAVSDMRLRFGMPQQQMPLPGSVSAGYQSPMWQQQRVNPQTQFAAPQVQSFNDLGAARRQQQESFWQAMNNLYPGGQTTQTPWNTGEAPGGGSGGSGGSGDGGGDGGVAKMMQKMRFGK